MRSRGRSSVGVNFVRQRRHTAAASFGSSSGAPSSAATDIFAAFDKALRDAAASADAGGTGRWEVAEKCWVLFPENDTPPAGVVHFCGGAFASAAPVLTYRLFLETLSQKGALVVVATPYATSFDHLRVADEVQFAFDRAVRALAQRLPADLPVWGMGHSMGALAQCLVASRYAVPRAGNVLISFNNKPASDAIPLFGPVVSPLAQGLNPLVTGITTSPFRPGVDSLAQQLRNAAPSVVREALPLLDQLEGLALDVTSGRTEFTPSPPETQRLIQANYRVPRTLLIRFKDDSIDETPALAATLTSCLDGGNGELTVSVLPGDHVRPLQQIVPPPPPEVLGGVQMGAAALDTLSGFAQALGPPALLPAFALNTLRSGVRSGLDTLQSVTGSQSGPVADISTLTDGIVSWMGVQAAPAASKAESDDTSQ